MLGQRVDLKIVDESAGTGLDELLAAGVDAIVGPASSTVALSQLAEALLPVTGVVTCSPSATALALDDYPDNKLFFRTVPSDSLEMVAIERRVERTGVETVAVGYLDDPYGRGLKDAFVAGDRRARRGHAAGRRSASRPTKRNSTRSPKQLLAGGAGVIVVLGDADDGTRLLQAIDVATTDITPPQVMVNDAIRDGRQAIQALTPEFRARLSGVGPVATTIVDGGPEGFFTANAVDCVNLIALAAIQAGSDDPGEITKNMASVSVGGQVCTDFADCAERLAGGPEHRLQRLLGRRRAVDHDRRAHARMVRGVRLRRGGRRPHPRPVRGLPRSLATRLLDVVEVADEERARTRRRARCRGRTAACTRRP